MRALALALVFALGAGPAVSYELPADQQVDGGYRFYISNEPETHMTVCDEVAGVLRGGERLYDDSRLPRGAHWVVPGVGRTRYDYQLDPLADIFRWEVHLRVYAVNDQGENGRRIRAEHGHCWLDDTVDVPALSPEDRSLD